jgi:uncharacterized protein (TIGR02147 family)
VYIKNELKDGKGTNHMPDIFAYTDYRAFLRDLLTEKRSKSAAFSLRQISRRAGIRSTGFFSWVLQGKRNISERVVLELIKILKLNRPEAEYFSTLVHYNQARTIVERKRYFDDLATFKRKGYKAITPDHYEFYRHWYYAALRELVAITRVTDGNLAQKAKLLSPRLRPSEMKKGLMVLKKLGMIRISKNGVYERVDDVVSTGPQTEAVAVQSYQIACMELAKTAYDRFERRQREMSTVTMSVDSDALGAIMDRLRKAREDIMEIARATATPTRVVQLNMQVFPLSKEIGEQA